MLFFAIVFKDRIFFYLSRKKHNIKNKYKLKAKQKLHRGILKFMFDWTIWLGIGFGVAAVIIAFIYTLVETNKEWKEKNGR